MPCPVEIDVPAERARRVELAAAYRIIHHFGLTTLIQNHISARVPGASQQLFINPYGVRYDEVSASNLVRIDIEGKVIQAGAGPFGDSVNPAGLVIHRAVHGAREDALCVVHTHTVAGTAVSALECGLVPVCIEALQFYKQIGYHAFEGISLNPEECPRIAADLGDKRVLILKNHGLLTVGRTIAEAVVDMLYLERACEVQLAAMSTGQALVHVSDAICARAGDQVAGFVHGRSVAELTFASLVRMLDEREPSYRR